MSKKAFLISGILIPVLLVVVSTDTSAQVANTKTVVVNGGGDKGTTDFGTIKDGQTAELIVKTTECKNLTGSIDKGDKDGWRGGEVANPFRLHLIRRKLILEIIPESSVDRSMVAREGEEEAVETHGLFRLQ